MNVEAEWHPWLKLFIILAIVFAAIMIIPGFGITFGWGPEHIDPGGILMIIGSILVISGGVRVLHKTAYFTLWRETRGWDRVLAYIMIYFGINVFIALILVAPFMRIITDPIGDSLGLRTRR